MKPRIFLILASLSVSMFVATSEAQEITLYDSIRSIDAPNGFTLYSEPSTSSSVIKRQPSTKSFNAAGYLKKADGTFYVSDWSLEQNKLTGNVGATIVAADAGGAAKTSFTNGVAVYVGGQTGLMAGMSVGMDIMRFEATGG